MSVIIKGMKMPKNCEECTFHSTEDIFFDIVHECEVKNNYIIKDDIHIIPLDCPLIEFPDYHGRLIDADALVKDLKYDVELDAKALDDTEFTWRDRDIIQFDKDCKQNAVDLLQKSPTVIEANVHK